MINKIENTLYEHPFKMGCLTTILVFILMVQIFPYLSPFPIFFLFLPIVYVISHYLFIIHFQKKTVGEGSSVNG